MPGYFLTTLSDNGPLCASQDTVPFNPDHGTEISRRRGFYACSRSDPLRVDPTKVWLEFSRR